jgi:hypothetical protein
MKNGAISGGNSMPSRHPVVHETMLAHEDDQLLAAAQLSCAAQQSQLESCTFLMHRASGW